MTRPFASHIGFALATLSAAFLLAGCGSSQSSTVRIEHRTVLCDAKTVAVFSFVDAPGCPGSGKVVVSPVISELCQCPSLKVIERERLATILKEKDLSDAGVTTADAGRIGKLAGADLAIVGEVTQYESTQESSSFSLSIVKSGGTNRTFRVGLSVRVIDVNSGEGQVVYADLGQGTSSGKDSGYSPAAQVAARQALSNFRKALDRGDAD